VPASLSGPLVQIRDLRVDALHGDRFVRELEPGSNVRVSVGWHDEGEFEPFAVGIEVMVPHLTPTQAVAQEMAVWAPAGRAPSADEPRWPLPFVAHAPMDRGRATPEEPRWRAPLTNIPAGRSPRRAPEAAPVDTGVEIWPSPVSVGAHAEGTAASRPMPETRADQVALSRAHTWFQPGGSSEHGGASELGHVI